MWIRSFMHVRLVGRVPMRRRHSPQTASSSIVERVTTKVFIHSKAAIWAAATSHCAASRRSTWEERITRRRKITTHRSTAHRWHWHTVNRWIWSLTATHRHRWITTIVHHIARIVIPTIVVVEISETVHDAIAKESWRWRWWQEISALTKSWSRAAAFIPNAWTFLAPVAASSAAVARFGIAHA